MGLETIALVAGAALSAAGTGVQMNAAHQEHEAMTAKVNQEMLRQQALDVKARSAFHASADQSGVETANKQIAQGTQARADEYTRLGAIPIGASEASPLTQTSSQKEAVEGQDTAERGARAAGGGYSESDLQNWIKNIRATQTLGMLGQEARGSAALLPQEIQRASYSKEGQHAVGAGLSALGAVVGAYGAVAPALSGAAAGASSGATAYQLGGTTAGVAPSAFYRPNRAPMSYGWQMPSSPSANYYTLPTTF